MNVKSQSELDIGGRETCYLLLLLKLKCQRPLETIKVQNRYGTKVSFVICIDVFALKRKDKLKYVI